MTDLAESVIRSAILACLCQAALRCPPAAADIVPPPGRVDSRIRETDYSSDQVYRLRGFVGYQIDLQFEIGETFVGIGAGDLEGLSYVGNENHLFLKPRAATVATNLTVLTNRRHYQFEYVALPQRPSPRDPEVIFALRFNYPSPRDAVERIEADLGAASSRHAANTDYWYCGSAELQPVLASDDGIHTRLRFAARAELPAIFVHTEAGGETLLNYSMDDGDVVIHRLAQRFVLRRGALAGCILNKGFQGTGTRLDSGTVTPEVERRLQEQPR